MPLSAEQKWQLGLVSVTLLVTSVLSIVILLILKSGQGVPVPPQIPNPDLFPDFQPAPSSKSITLYSDFVFDDIISTPNIIKNSRIIQLEGKLGSGALFVRASARPEYCWDEVRKHSVYFYVDNGDHGGQIDAVRENAVITQGGFTNAQSPYQKSFPLSAVPVAQRVNGHTTIDVIELLKNQMPHYVGAFVATGRCGVLNELKIDYTCSTETPDCSIRFSE